MEVTGDEIHKEIKEILNKGFIPVIADQLDHELKQLNEILGLISDYSKSPLREENSIANHTKYIESLFSIISTKWKLPDPIDFKDAYPELLVSLENSLSKLDIETIKIQNKERFYNVPDDGQFLKISKFLKRSAFFVNKLPARLTNLFRTNKKNILFWRQKIVFQNLARKHFHGELVMKLVKITDIFYLELSSQYKKLKDWEKQVTEYDVEKRVYTDFEITFNKEELLDKIRKELELILDETTENFNNQIEKSGTIELPVSKLSDIKVERLIKSGQKRWSENNTDWKNTVYALFETWRSNLDILLLRDRTDLGLLEFEKAQIKKVLDSIDPEVKAILSFIEESSASLNNEDQTLLVKTLKKVVYQANKSLDKQLVPELCEKLTNGKITNQINRLEASIKMNVDQVAHNHVILEKDSYKRPIAMEEFSKVSLNELIRFEILPVLQEKLEGSRKALFNALENTTTNVSDLDHIITFSLYSAIAAEEEEGKEHGEVLSIALDGLQRAAARLTAAREELENSLALNIEKISEAVDSFCNEVLELSDNESVNKLKLRITKAKATLQAEEVKEELRNSLISRKEKTLIYLKGTYGRLKGMAETVSDNFILTAGKPVLTKEVSDFLLESQSAIDKLPLIYKRLYKIEPLEDLELFEGRTYEIENFNAALQNWSVGKFVSVAIIGEKWGGQTTFLNYVIKTEKLPCAVKRISLKDSICEENELIKLINEVSFKEEIDSLDELIQLLNSGSKQIIVIENIQNLYLRKPGGFKALQTLFSLVSETCTKVLWVISCTAYGWNYLKKSIGIHEVFSHEIEMKDFTKDQITNVILKRNRISGFKIKFLADEERMKEKRFLKLDEAQQQILLKEDFFSLLNDFSKSNVSLALIFWLFSTQEINQDTITIGSFKFPNLNFINSLSMDKVYVLLSLVLHDGLNTKELSAILNMTVQNCQQVIFALQKDGIIIYQKKEYTINSIVYRNIISLLKAKNLIH